MSEQMNSQREDNRSLQGDLSVVPLSEALWRLRLSPSALDLHTVLPEEAFLSPVLLDFTRLLDDVDVELLDIHAVLMLPPGPAEILS